MVDDRMVDAFSIYGTPAELNEKIDGLKKFSVTQVVAGSPICPNMNAAAGSSASMSSNKNPFPF